jgi:hypothetical protein
MRSHSLNLLTANCLQQRFAIAPLQLPQTSFFNEPQRHRGHREREIAPLQLPKNDRTPLTPKQRSHPLNSPNSDRTPSTSQTAIASLQPPKQRSHPFNFPTSFFNKPRRSEEHEERREESAIAYFCKKQIILTIIAVK